MELVTLFYLVAIIYGLSWAAQYFRYAERCVSTSIQRRGSHKIKLVLVLAAAEDTNNRTILTTAILLWCSPILAQRQ